MRRCIISWARNGREWYSEGIKRLIPSAIAHGQHYPSPENGFIIVSPDCNVEIIAGIKIHRNFPGGFDVPDHSIVPYGFKPWLFKIANYLGFHQVLWCDSTIVIHKNLDVIWNLSARDGLFVADNPGCPICHWTSDDAMDQMGCPRDCLLDEIMACAIGIDFTTEIGKKVFSEWFELCNDGITFSGKGKSERKDFRDHRHDQSALSWLCHKNKIPLQPYGLLSYRNDMMKFDEHILVNTGLTQ